MKKRNLIIIISVLLVVLTTLIVIVVKNKKSETTKGKSEELLAAEKMFSEVILDEKKNEYILKRLQNNSNTYKAKIEIPDTIDNIPVTMLIDSNDFASFSNVITIKLGKNIKWIGNSIPSDEELATNEFGNSIFVNATSLTEINVSDEKVKEVEDALADGSLHVFDTSTFTVDGKELTTYKKDGSDTEYISDGYFHESEYGSAPAFDIAIDGITSITE